MEERQRPAFVTAVWLWNCVRVARFRHGKPRACKWQLVTRIFEETRALGSHLSLKDRFHMGLAQASPSDRRLILRKHIFFSPQKHSSRREKKPPLRQVFTGATQEVFSKKL